MEAMLIGNFLEKEGVFQLRAWSMISRKRGCFQDTTSMDLKKGGVFQKATSIDYRVVKSQMIDYRLIHSQYINQATNI